MLKKSLQQCLRTQQSVLDSMARGQALEDCLFRVCRNLESAVLPQQARAFLLLKEPDGAYSQKALKNKEQDGGLHKELAQNLALVSSIQSHTVSDLTQPSFAFPNYLQQKLLQAGWQSIWVEPVLSSSKQCLAILVFQTRERYEPDHNNRNMMAAYVRVLSCILEKNQKDTEVRSLNTQLKASLDRLQVYYQVMPDIGMILSDSGQYLDIYGTHEVLGHENTQNLIGKNIYDCLDPGIARDIMDATHKAMNTGQAEVFEYEMSINDQIIIFESRVMPIQKFLPSDPNKHHVVWMARDITQRRLSEKRIERLAFYDPLTQLPNRRLLMDRLQHTIDHVKRQKTIGSLIFIDLDGFKAVNDQFGHDYGDKLLMAVAKRLKESLRDTDTVARFGGDEFVIVLERFDDMLENMYNEVMNVSNRILDYLKSGIMINGQPFMANASMGVSMIYGQDTQVDTVIKEADSAMYQAKHTGKGKICFFQQNQLDKTLNAKA